MVVRVKSFKEEKERVLESLKTAVDNNQVDEKIMMTLEAINSNQMYFTTSSCGGRISLGVAPIMGKKKEHEFIKMWHRKVRLDELMDSIPEVWKGVLWLKMESFILHVSCRDMEAAEKLLKIAIKLGLKRSGIFRINPFPMIEIIATDYVSVPLGKDGKLFATQEYLSFLIALMNKRLEENDRKLERFRELFIKESG